MPLLIAQKWLPGLVLGSGAYVLCFPEYNLPVFSFLVMPLLLWGASHLRSLKQALLAGLLFSSAVALGGFYWIIHAVQANSGLPIFFGVLCLLIYCLIASPHAYVFFAIAHYSKEPFQKPWQRALYWSSLFVALEFIARYVKIFPEHLGNTWFEWNVLAQNADWGGVSVLSFAPLFIGATFAELLRARNRQTILLFAVSLGFLTLLYGYGHFRLEHLKNWSDYQTIKASVIQANIGNVEKIASESGNAGAISRVIERYIEMSERAAQDRPQLIVWPETAYPIAFPTEESSRRGAGDFYANELIRRMREVGIPFLMGGYESINGMDFNSMILFNEKMEWQNSYRKSVLLILGEYMPFSDWFPVLASINPQMGGFARGKGAFPIDWLYQGQKINIGANICYEAILPDFMRVLAKNGAQIFINVTNDSWFGPRGEPWQHLQLAQMRVIENRVPLLRSTNTGISTAYNILGESLGTGPLFQETTLSFEISLPKKPIFTLYKFWGEAFAILLVLLHLTLFIWKRQQAQA